MVISSVVMGALVICWYGDQKPWVIVLFVEWVEWFITNFVWFLVILTNVTPYMYLMVSIYYGCYATCYGLFSILRVIWLGRDYNAETWLKIKFATSNFRMYLILWIVYKLIINSVGPIVWVIIIMIIVSVYLNTEEFIDLIGISFVRSITEKVGKLMMKT